MNHINFIHVNDTVKIIEYLSRIKKKVYIMLELVFLTHLLVARIIIKHLIAGKRSLFNFLII